MIRQTSPALVIEADDHRIIWYRLSDKIKIQKDGADADLKAFEKGDQVTVDSTEDEDGLFTAVEVQWRGAGSAADKAAAAATWDLPKLARLSPAPGSGSSTPAPTRAPGDDRPILRKNKPAPEQPAEASTAPEVQPQQSAQASAAQPPGEQQLDELDTRPTTTMRPADAKTDDDGSGPPVLRRGAPAPRKAASSSASVQEPETQAQPPAPAQQQVARENPADAEAPQAILPQEDPLIEKAREVLGNYAASLPNFFVQQLTTRYQTENIKQGWHAADTVSADLAYEDGKESYKNIKVGGKAVNKAMDEIGGSTSTGEFATVVAAVLNPGSGATYRKGGTDTIRGRSAYVFKFDIPRERSSWRIEAPSQLYYPAYRGSIWIDKETSRILRIEQEGRALPLLFPFDSTESSVDYDFVRLGTTQSFLLPVEAEVLTCVRGSRSCMRNKIEFRNYRKFGSESSVTFNN